MCKWEKLSHLTVQVLVRPKTNEQDTYLSALSVKEKDSLDGETCAISHYYIIALTVH